MPSFLLAADCWAHCYILWFMAALKKRGCLTRLLATQTMKKGATVNILLCGEAGSLAVKNSPEILLKPNDKSPQMLVKNLIQNGVNVELCPPYLPNKEKNTSDLIAGVSVAKPSMVADKLLHENTKILSY